MKDFRTYATELEALEALPDHARLTNEQASKALSLWGLSYTPNTLTKMRCQSTNGPRYIKLGHFVAYEVGALREFAGIKKRAIAA